MSTVLEEIFQETVKRYSDRFRKLGRHVRALGWGTEEQQRLRFETTLRGLPRDLSSRKILDIGCGFGDYYAFLKERGLRPASYLGWDINPDFIAEARRLFAGEPGVFFERKNLFEVPENHPPVAQVGVMLGLLNYNLAPRFDNYEYSRMALRKAFSLVSEVLVVDFISSCRTAKYPKEDFIFYHDPSCMLREALKLTPRVVLLHDYPPIPQREFMLFLYKTNEKCVL